LLTGKLLKGEIVSLMSLLKNFIFFLCVALLVLCSFSLITAPYADAVPTCAPGSYEDGVKVNGLANQVYTYKEYQELLKGALHIREAKVLGADGNPTQDTGYIVNIANEELTMPDPWLAKGFKETSKVSTDVLYEILTGTKTYNPSGKDFGFGVSESRAKLLINTNFRRARTTICYIDYTGFKAVMKQMQLRNDGNYQINRRDYNAWLNGSETRVYLAPKRILNKPLELLRLIIKGIPYYEGRSGFFLNDHVLNGKPKGGLGKLKTMHRLTFEVAASQVRLEVNQKHLMFW